MKRLEHKQITIDFNIIKQIKPTDYNKLMFLTLPEYREYASLPPGVEHYALISYFATLFSKSPFSFIDIGTRFGTSALAMAAYGHHVITYDLPGSNELNSAIIDIKMTKTQWNNELKKLGCNITAVEAHILQLSVEEFEPIRRAPFIVLDTHHRPYSTPFEREFIDRLVASKYAGVVILDDIHEHSEMDTWFDELVCSRYRPFTVYDITQVGHATGTGLLDFGSRVRFIGKGTETILESPTNPRCECRKIPVSKKNE